MGEITARGFVPRETHHGGRGHARARDDHGVAFDSVYAEEKLSVDAGDSAPR